MDLEGFVQDNEKSSVQRSMGNNNQLRKSQHSYVFVYICIHICMNHVYDFMCIERNKEGYIFNCEHEMLLL